VSKKIEFVFTLFDFTGVVQGQNRTHQYTYYVDGTVAIETARLARRSVGRALNYLKLKQPNPIKEVLHGKD